MTLCVTRHAEVRMQQRGVSPQVLDLLMQYGCRVHAGKGAEIVFFDKKARRRLRRHPVHRRVCRDSKQLNSYAVCRDEIVVTAGKRYKRIRR